MEPKEQSPGAQALPLALQTAALEARAGTRHSGCRQGFLSCKFTSFMRTGPSNHPLGRPNCGAHSIFFELLCISKLPAVNLSLSMLVGMCAGVYVADMVFCPTTEAPEAGLTQLSITLGQNQVKERVRKRGRGTC